MNNLLKAEFYKLRNLKSYWGMLIISILLGSILALDNSTTNTLKASILTSLYNIPILYLLTIIFGALFIGGDFETRTVQTYISAGHKRNTILLTKTIVFLFSSITILSAPLMVNTIINMLIWGSLGSLKFQFFTKYLILILLMLCAMTMLNVFFSFLFKDVGKALAVPMSLYFIMILLLNGNKSHFFLLFLPMGQIRQLSLVHLDMPFLPIAMINLCWILFCYLGAYLAFCHSDLK